MQNTFRKLICRTLAWLCCFAVVAGVFGLIPRQGVLAEGPSGEIYTFSDYSIQDGTYSGSDSCWNLEGNALMGNTFSGYFKFSGQYEQFFIGGNNETWYGLYFLSYADGLLLQTNGGYFDNVITITSAAAGTTLIGEEFKMTISLTPLANGDVKLGLWFNDTLFGGDYITLSKSGGNCKELFGNANSILIAPNGGSVSVRSVAEEESSSSQPDLENLLTFSDYEISDGTYSGSDSCWNLEGNALMGNTFSGYFKFSGQYEQFFIGGNNETWYGLYFLSYADGLLLQTNGGYFDNVITITSVAAGTTLIGEEFKMTISLTPLANGDVKLGLWFNDTLFGGDYITLSKSGGNCKELFGNANSILIAPNGGSVSVRSIEKGEEAENPEDPTKSPDKFYTFSDGSLADGDYTTEAGVALKENITLMNGAFSGFIKLSGETGQQLILGGNNTPYGGLYFFPWNGSLALVAANGEFDNIVLFDDTTAKVKLLNNEVKLTVSLKPAQNGDVELGVWFNDVLYNGSFITLSKAGGNCEELFGSANGIHITPAEGTISIRSNGNPSTSPDEPKEPETPDEPIAPILPDSKLKKLSFSSFGIKDSVYSGNGGAELAASGEYINPAGESTLYGTLFEADITFSSAGGDFRIGGKENPWFGLMFYSSGDTIYMINAEKTTGEWYPVLFESSVAGTKLTDKAVNFKLSLQLVDHDSSGGKDDLQIGVWFNDKLYRNQYIYYNGYGDQLGTKLGIYCANADSTITVKSAVIDTTPDFSIFGFTENWASYFKLTIPAKGLAKGKPFDAPIATYPKTGDTGNIPAVSLLAVTSLGILLVSGCVLKGVCKKGDNTGF